MTHVRSKIGVAWSLREPLMLDLSDRLISKIGGLPRLDLSAGSLLYIEELPYHPSDTLSEFLLPIRSTTFELHTDAPEPWPAAVATQLRTSKTSSPACAQVSVEIAMPVSVQTSTQLPRLKPQITCSISQLTLPALSPHNHFSHSLPNLILRALHGQFPTIVRMTSLSILMSAS